ncbi:MAG: hypothetical protein HC866_05290 [Leptolyngbyaceae cyanobacterium RU_5_1]|nr:hypothetical protein [Leptolyngbyaceae cyanobacterium RU_5_1]
MDLPRSSRFNRLNFKSLGLEFWLPLPFVATLFWFGGELVNQQLLSYAYNPNRYLQTDEPAKIQFSASVLAIEVEINQRLKFTKAIVKTTNSPLKTLELEFPLTEVAEVEAAIASELNVSIETVKSLSRFQFKE